MHTRWAHWVIGGLIAAGLAVTLTGAGSPPLRELINEYNQLSFEHRIRPAEYRAWLDRFTEAIRRDGSAKLSDLRVARGIQLELANGLNEWELSMQFADECRALALSVSDAATEEYNGAYAAFMLYQRTKSRAHGEMALERLKAFNTRVKHTPEILDGNSPQESLWRLYVATLSLEGQVREELLQEHLEAAGLYLKAEETLRTKGSPFPEDIPSKAENLLSKAMVAFVKGGQVSRAEEVLSRLAKLDNRRRSLGFYVYELAKAESPNGGAKYQERLRHWLHSAAPTDEAWPQVAWFLARDQLKSEDDAPAAIDTLRRLLNAYENQPPPGGHNWPALQRLCYYYLARLYVARDPEEARAFAARYLATSPPDNRQTADMKELVEKPTRNPASLREPPRLEQPSPERIIPPRHPLPQGAGSQ